MADKEKRIQKFLNRLKMKGKLKSVKTLEEANIIIVEDLQCRGKNVFFNKQGYEQALSRGNTFPEDSVHFMVPTNPRNTMEVARSIITKFPGAVALPL